MIEINVGLPGGAHEYDLTCRVHDGRPSDIFRTIEAISLETSGTTFARYLGSLPWISGLKAFKLWMDGQGPYPDPAHPALRLEDKWGQYGVLSSRFRMPETMVFEPGDLPAAKRFLAALAPEHEVNVLAFNDNLFTLARRGADPSARLRDVDRLAAWGSTALYDAIVYGLDSYQHWASVGQWKFVERAILDAEPGMLTRLRNRIYDVLGSKL